jgi:hypothetical protein
MYSHKPDALIKEMQAKNLYEVDQFAFRDWEPDNRQLQREWKKVSDKIRQDAEPAFTIRQNLVDTLVPFVNKRGERNKYFQGEDHQVRLTQVDDLPCTAKLVYMNHDLETGTMVPVELRSRETFVKDLKKASKKLFKKAKPLVKG